MIRVPPGIELTAVQCANGMSYTACKDGRKAHLFISDGNPVNYDRASRNLVRSLGS
jgi:hypothetical protein